MDLSNLVSRLSAINWQGFQRPSYAKSVTFPKAIESLARLSNPQEAQQLYSRVLFGVGNNHAGTLYPVAVAAVDFIVEIALHGPTPEARQCAAEILIEMNIFDAEPGFEVVSSPGLPQGKLTDIVRGKIRRFRDEFDRNSKSENEPNQLKDSLVQLVADIDEHHA